MHTINKLVIAAALVAGTIGIAVAEDAAPDSVKRYEPIFGDSGLAMAAWQNRSGGVMYFEPIEEIALPIEETAFEPIEELEEEVPNS